MLFVLCGQAARTRERSAGMVKVNGEFKNQAGQPLLLYLQEEGYDRNRIAVERNGVIVPKQQYDSVVLEDGDEIEIVSFVGGG